MGCGCHEWYDVAEIGDWLIGLGGNLAEPVPVRQWATSARIWEPGRYETFTHDELADLIIAAGHQILCAHALSATTYADGRIGLSNGVHRWAIADELGIARVPVDMVRETIEPVWAYIPGYGRP